MLTVVFLTKSIKNKSSSMLHATSISWCIAVYCHLICLNFSSCNGHCIPDQPAGLAWHYHSAKAITLHFVNNFYSSCCSFFSLPNLSVSNTHTYSCPTINIEKMFISASQILTFHTGKL